jgi:peptidase M23-like protein
MTILKALGLFAAGLALALGGFAIGAWIDGENIIPFNPLKMSALWETTLVPDPDKSLLGLSHALLGDVHDTSQTPGTFAYFAPGELVGRTGVGLMRKGAADWTLYAPQMAFPIKNTLPGYLNSQIYSPGGGGYRGLGSNNQCAVANYTYPWRDNFCERRSGTVRESLNCPSQNIHQGLDIRGGSGGAPDSACYRMAWQGEKSLVPVVAVEAGRIEYSKLPYKYVVLLITDTGRVYRYMHLERSSLELTPGTRIEQGTTIGYLSNYYGRSQTTHHLHFEFSQNVAGKGFSHVSPYMSLVRAYERDHGLEAVLVE